MPLICFLSYSTTERERVFAYRLQTLAGASDIELLLPERQRPGLTEETRHRIRRSDVVIAFFSTSSAAARQEVEYAQELGKPILALIPSGRKRPALKDVRWIEYEREDVRFSKVEARVLEELRSFRKSGDQSTALLLVLLGLGLLALMGPRKGRAA